MKAPSRLLSSACWLRLLPVFVAALSLGSYLFVSAIYFKTGFPLDDAWIHQTYARNLATRGEWSFIPGQISAGSTSPLWSLLLAAGHLLPGLFQFWTYLSGGVCLIGLVLIGQAALRALLAEYSPRLPWMALLLALEWHLVWAAGSGMETPLHALLILLTLAVILRSPFNPWLAGGLAGVAVWVRPDGLTLMGPVVFVLWLSRESWPRRAGAVVRALAGFGLFVGPYLLFNRLLAGVWWPNTFFAKQAEYAVMTQSPLLVRLVSLFTLPWVGVGVLLLPGALYLLWGSFRNRRWAVLAAFLWWAGYTGLYALRLPVTYQHGRYLMPSMPVFWLLGLAGSIDLARKLPANLVGRVIRRSWALTVAAVLLGFYGLGALTYAQDVAIIETEMVASARWVAANTPSDSLVAAHDIGAMGFFGARDLLDLAGLISPQVIPFIRDEERLADYMDEQRVDYLVTFPGWYTHLEERGRRLFSTGAPYAPRFGGENMAVYAWP